MCVKVSRGLEHFKAHHTLIATSIVATTLVSMSKINIVRGCAFGTG